jgi:arylsulfatase A-like enzyme
MAIFHHHLRSALLLVVLTVTSAFAAERPNIILLMGDDHGWEETGYNGHPHVKTPVLDEMAASGLRLDHFYAHPSCSPTRGSVLTGRHPNRYGTFSPGFSLRPEERTIAHALKAAGYRCGHFGKWHVGPVKASSPTNPKAMGFDTYVSHDNFFELDPSLSRQGGPPEEFKGESSAIIVNEALHFIKDATAKQRPFLAVIWFGSPHEPYSGLPDDLALYDDLPAELAKKTVSLTSNTTGRRVKRPLRDVLRERYAEITAMDRAIGTLRTRLAAEKLHKNTMLWYCGDNGTPPSGVLASPFRGLKGQTYEGGIRVPGIIEWPERIPEARISTVNSITSDMLPTLCAIAGRAPPKRPLDGINLLPMINGGMQTRPGPLFFWMYDQGREAKAGYAPYLAADRQSGTTPLVKLMGGIATRNFRNYRHPTLEDWNRGGDRAILQGKYKLHVRRNGERQLFDLAADSAERHNLAAEKPEIVDRLDRQLVKWQDSVLNSLTGADY